jgi:hypothetical protein
MTANACTRAGALVLCARSDPVARGRAADCQDRQPTGCAGEQGPGGATDLLLPGAGHQVLRVQPDRPALQDQADLMAARAHARPSVLRFGLPVRLLHAVGTAAALGWSHLCNYKLKSTKTAENWLPIYAGVTLAQAAISCCECECWRLGDGGGWIVRCSQPALPCGSG